MKDYKAENERLEHIRKGDKQRINSLNKCYKLAKSEAIKEFAKRLKEKAKMYNSEGVEEGDLIDDLLTVGETVEIINKLVKEMTEEEK